MIQKKGWLAKAEARTNGFYINGKKEKGANLTQEFCDNWNGVKKAKPVVVEEVVEEVATEEVVEEAPKKKLFGKKKAK